MSFSAPLRKEFTEVLLKGYPTRFKLVKMVSNELGKNLEEIAPNEGLEQSVFMLIQAAEAEGWVDQLVKGAHTGNPGNQKLLGFLESYEKGSIVEPNRRQFHTKIEAYPVQQAALGKKSAIAQQQPRLNKPETPLLSEKAVAAVPQSPMAAALPSQKEIASEPPHSSSLAKARVSSDDAIYLAQKHVSASKTHFQAAMGLFAINGDIRLFQCARVIQHLRAINTSLQYLSKSLNTRNSIPPTIALNYGRLIVVLDRIDELTRSSIESIRLFRQQTTSSRSNVIAQGIKRTYDDLAHELDKLAEIFHL